MGFFLCGSSEAQIPRSSGKAVGATATIRWQEEGQISRPTWEVAKTFALKAGDVGKSMDVGPDNKTLLMHLNEKNTYCDVVACNHFPNAAEERLLARKSSKDAQLSTYTVGWRGIAVIVNSNNTVRKLSLADLGKLLNVEGKTLSWQAVGGKGGSIHCYGETKDSWSRDLLRRECLGSSEQMPGYVRHGWRPVRDDFHECASAEEVIKKVKADSGSIGFFQYTTQAILSIKDVRILAIGKEDKAAFVALKPEPIIPDGYLLAEPLVLYLNPQATSLAKNFCEFAGGPEGAAVVEQLGFITPHMQSEAAGKIRLTEMKPGKGEQVTAVGVHGNQKLLEAMATEYVRAKAVVQLGFTAGDTDSAAMGQFIGGDGRQGLLLLNDRPSDQAMQAFGTRWSALNPPEHLVAARVVAVVVNPANKIESLTMAQVRAIFGGEVADWSLIPGTGLGGEAAKGSLKTAGTKTSGTIAAASINCYSLPVGDPLSVVFQQEGLPAAKWRHVTAKKDSAEVLAAVATDSQGLGIVDLTAIPVGDKSVRVLAIGRPGKAVSPIPESLRNAMYPFAQRVYLYVHPKAGNAAKGFAAFLSTCGQSTGNGSTDTVKTVMTAYRKQGLIPLADVVLERTAKEALIAPAPAVPTKAVQGK
jgi:ABC-type phosphate transport system substrate-binding protein